MRISRLDKRSVPGRESTVGRIYGCYGMIRNRSIITKDRNPLRTLPARGFITIKYNTHRIIITIIIVLIKNYYVNSYLTTCMAQSITLVSCNNNNKDTTIYLLVSSSSFFDLHRLLWLRETLFTLVYLYVFLSLFSFSFLQLPRYYISPRIFAFRIFFTRW